MTIYNKYGTAKQEYQDKLSFPEMKEILNLILNMISDEPLPIQRELFNYAISELQCLFSQYIIDSVIKMREEERKLK